jgi:hypothetical protein
LDTGPSKRSSKLGGYVYEDEDQEGRRA